MLIIFAGIGLCPAQVIRFSAGAVVLCRFMTDLDMWGLYPVPESLQDGEQSGLPTHTKLRLDRRFTHCGSGGDGRFDRLALFPCLRLSQRVRRLARRQESGPF